METYNDMNKIFLSLINFVIFVSFFPFWLDRLSVFGIFADFISACLIITYILIILWLWNKKILNKVLGLILAISIIGLILGLWTSLQSFTKADESSFSSLTWLDKHLPSLLIIPCSLVPINHLFWTNNLKK